MINMSPLRINISPLSRIILKGLLGTLLVIYPVLVYFGLQAYGPRIVATFLFMVASARTLMHRDTTNLWLWLAALSAAAFSGLSNSPLGLKFYPVIVSTIMLIIFCLSLYKGPSFIERLARLQDPNLPPEGITYCRKVTLIWCIFFILNAVVAFITVFSSDKIWLLYNGLISYITMGLLLSGEIFYRKYILRQKSQSKTPKTAINNAHD